MESTVTQTSGKLRIKVIIGSTRPSRFSERPAQYIFEELCKIQEVETELVDLRDYPMPFFNSPVSPARGTGRYEDKIVQDWADKISEGDAFIIVTPEYNHSFPSSLKRMLDSELQNYIHKPVAFAGVSNGIFGGARAIESLLPTVREMGMAVTFSDVYFPQVQNLFNANSEINDSSYIKRIKRAYEELIWMAKALKWGRENVSSIYHKPKENT